MERRGKAFLFLTALAVAAFARPAFAEEPEAVDERIDGAFGLVLQNTLELAVPLSRRALSQRSIEDEGEGALLVQPSEATQAQSDTGAAAAAAEPADAEIEEGSAEDSELARIPRPRPPGPGDDADVALNDGAAGNFDTGANAPLDLVAGAALAPSVEPAAVVALEQPAVSAEAPAGQGGPDLPLAPSPEQVAQLAELTASGACLAVSELADEDGDFARNADALVEAGFCIKREELEERRRDWTLQTIDSGRPGPLWAVMHDDEDVAFDNALQALRAYGGMMVAVETGGERNLDGVDPNRNFSADGIGCSKLGNDASPEYTAFFKGLINPAQPIFVLHNNPDGPIPTGGVGHLTMETLPRDTQSVASSDPDGPLADSHTLVLIASEDPVPAAVEARAESLAGKGVNVVLEPIRESRGDCSFSNYAILSGHDAYFNVTVDHDGRDKQRQIVAVIMESFFTIAASVEEPRT